MNLALGGTLRCSDGTVRELGDVVVDAAGRRVTHLVVQPKNHHDAARLVSLDLAVEDGKGLTLSCTEEMLNGLEPVHEYAYLPAGSHPEQSGEWSVGIEDVLVVPDYESFDGAEPDFDPNINLTYDRVPKGAVELRRTSSVYTADEHHVGTVHGLVVGEGGAIAELTLLRGHLWWRREISVPAAAIESLENDLVTLGVDKRGLKPFSSRRARS
jgi:uncharacterized protein YrrD